MPGRPRYIVGALLFVLIVVMLVGSSSTAADQSFGPMTYKETVARGLPMPVLAPDLPICEGLKLWPGFRNAAEMEAVVRNEESAICQRDPRRGSYMIKPARPGPR